MRPYCKRMAGTPWRAGCLQTDSLDVWRRSRLARGNVGIGERVRACGTHPTHRIRRIESAIGCASAHPPDNGDDFAATAACLVQNFVRIAIYSRPPKVSDKAGQAAQHRMRLSVDGYKKGAVRRLCHNRSQHRRAVMDFASPPRMGRFTPPGSPACRGRRCFFSAFCLRCGVARRGGQARF